MSDEVDDFFDRSRGASRKTALDLAFGGARRRKAQQTAPNKSKGRRLTASDILTAIAGGSSDSAQKGTTIRKGKTTATTEGHAKSVSAKSLYESLSSTSGSSSSSCLSSSGRSDDSDSEGEDVLGGLFMSTQERKEKRKKGLKKLTKSRKEREARPRRVHRTPVPPTSRPGVAAISSSKGKGKEKMVELSSGDDASEIDELQSSSPFHRPAARVSEASEPAGLNGLSEDDDLELPPPPTPVWKPRARPQRDKPMAPASNTVFASEGAKGKGPPPFESDKTVSSPVSSIAPQTSQASTPPPPSMHSRTRALNAAPVAGYDPEFALYPFGGNYSPEIYLPPPLVDLYPELKEQQNVHAPVSIRTEPTKAGIGAEKGGEVVPDSESMHVDSAELEAEGDGFVDSSASPKQAEPARPVYPPLMPTSHSHGLDVDSARNGAASSESTNCSKVIQTPAKATTSRFFAANVQSNPGPSMSASANCAETGESPFPPIKTEPSSRQPPRMPDMPDPKVSAKQEGQAREAASATLRLKRRTGDNTAAESLRPGKQRRFILQGDEEAQAKDIVSGTRSAEQHQPVQEAQVGAGEDEELSGECTICGDSFPLSILDAHERQEARELHESVESLPGQSERARPAGPSRTQGILAPAQPQSPRRSNQPFRPTMSTPLRISAKRSEPVEAGDNLADMLFPSPKRYSAREKGKGKPVGQTPQHRRVSGRSSQKGGAGDENIIDLDENGSGESYEEAVGDEDEVQIVSPRPVLTEQPRKGKRKLPDNSEPTSSPPAESLYLSKLPPDIRAGYYKMLGMNPEGQLPTNSMKTLVREPAKGQAITHGWAGKLKQDRMRTASTLAKDRKTWTNKVQKRRG